MINWPITKSFTINLSNERIGPCWIPNNEKEKKTKLPEKISNEFYRTGLNELLLKELISLIKQANKLICICTFILSEIRIVEALLEVVDRNGVNVYLLTASEKRLKDESLARSEDDLGDIREHKKMLNSLAGKILVRTAGFFHSKFILIDPTDLDNCSGFLLSPNLASNTFAEKLELGLRLNREEIRGVYNQFVLGFWGLSEHELFEPNRIRGISNTRPLDLNQIDKLIFSDIIFTAGQHAGLKERITELIDKTEGPIYLASFAFDKDHAILMKIKEEAKIRDIIIFARPRSPAMKSLIDLANHTNITVYGHPDLHAKGILSFNKKEPTAIMMTANFESLGLDSGFETGVSLRKEKAQVMLKIFIDWQNTFPHLLKPQLIRGEYEGEILFWNQYQFQRKSIEPSKQVDLGTFRVIDFAELDKFRPNLPQQDTEKILHQKLVYHWKNLPPFLPSKSEFLEKKENLEIYTKGDSRYIVISKPKEYDKALKLIEEENAMIVVKE